MTQPFARRAALFAAAAVVAFVAPQAGDALAGDSEAKIPGGGSARVQWNPVRYRKALVDQVSPGLLWRLGSGALTTIEVTGTAFIGDHGLLMPGSCALNLRYVTKSSWELICYDGTGFEFQWNESKRTHGIFPCRQWVETDPKKQCEKLEIEVKGLAASKLMKPPETTGGEKAGETTGGAGAAPAAPAAPVGGKGDVNYSKEAQAEMAASPSIQVVVKFGDQVGLIHLDAGKPDETKGQKLVDGKTKVPLFFRYAQVPTVRARTELADTGEDIPLGVLVEGKFDPKEPLPADGSVKEWFVRMSGTDNPQIEFRALNGASSAAPPKPVRGKRVATKTAGKTVTADFAGSVLTVHMFQADYVFDLAPAP